MHTVVMYFAYVDETGYDSGSPVFVMCGIVVDAVRLRRTQEDFTQIFSRLESITGRSLKELKSSDMLPGKGRWKGVQGETRRNLVTNLCEWIGSRRHSLVLAALDRSLHEVRDPTAKELTDIWLAGAVHVALQLQRCNQAKQANKGRTVLVFDDNKVGMDSFTDFVYEPAAWTSSYYGLTGKDLPLNQIVDSPFAVKSHHVGLVQIADLFAAIFRHHSELTDFAFPENYPGERAHYAEWVSQLAPRLIGRQHRLPSTSKSECAQWYRDLMPASLAQLK